jgi:hypothetical protein
MITDRRESVRKMIFEAYNIPVFPSAIVSFWDSVIGHKILSGKSKSVIIGVLYIVTLFSTYSEYINVCTVLSYCTYECMYILNILRKS